MDRDPLIDTMASLMSETAKCVLVFGALYVLLYWPWLGEVGL